MSDKTSDEPQANELTFRSSLSMEEIEHNFEGVDLFSELMDALEETAAIRKTEKAAGPFYSERNMEFLRRGIAALDAGEGVEHELLEAELVNEGLADLASGKTVDGDSVRARMVEKYGLPTGLSMDEMIDPSTGTKLTPEECREEFFKMVGMEVYCDEPSRVVPDEEMPEFEGKTWAEVRQEIATAATLLEADPKLTPSPGGKECLDNGEESKIL